MLAILKYETKIREEFYLDKDDITVRRRKDGYRKRFNQHDIVNPFKFKSQRGYEYGGIHIPRTRTTIAMHWVLTLLRGIPIPDGSVIDHINGNVKDNSRNNLRVTTQKINCRNRKIRHDNKTGYSGINYDDNANLYIVRKYVNGSRMYASARTLTEAVRELERFKRMAAKSGEAYIDRF